MKVVTKIGELTHYKMVPCPDCKAVAEAPCRDYQGDMKGAVHTNRMAMFRLRSPKIPLRRVEN